MSLPPRTLTWSLPALLLGAVLVRAGTLEPVPGAPLAALAGTTLAGQPWTLADHRGRVVLIHFWASWCGTCLEELPRLQALATRLRGRPFSLVAVAVQDSPLRVRTLAEQLHLGFTLLLDPAGTGLRDWGGGGLPTSGLVDGEGQIRWRGQGAVDWGDPAVTATIEALLREGAPAGH